jgi:hypothetical protein
LEDIQKDNPGENMEKVPFWLKEYNFMGQAHHNDITLGPTLYRAYTSICREDLMRELRIIVGAAIGAAREAPRSEHAELQDHMRSQVLQLIDEDRECKEWQVMQEIVGPSFAVAPCTGGFHLLYPR